MKSKQYQNNFIYINIETQIKQVAIRYDSEKYITILAYTLETIEILAGTALSINMYSYYTSYIYVDLV